MGVTQEMFCEVDRQGVFPVSSASFQASCKLRSFPNSSDRARSVPKVEFVFHLSLIRRETSERDPQPVMESQTSPHRCRHCEAVKIAVSDDVRSHYSPTRRQWRHALNHTVAEAASAASYGCLFFLRIWNTIARSETPASQLLRTQIQLELGTGETPGDLVAENSHSLVVKISTDHYSWPAAQFDLVSSYDDPSADHAISRCIIGDVSARCSLDQIQRRLDHCRMHHALCRPGVLYRDTPTTRPLRFLNVNPIGSDAKVTLVQSDSAGFEPYITLSYVWGQDQTIKT